MYHILLVKELHHKNENAILKYNIKFTRVNNISECSDLSIFDAVFCPGYSVDVSKYPNVKFIFGPHLSTFPNEVIHMIKSPNTIYIQPSQWVVDLWKLFPICNDLHMKVLPFGVDTNKFRPNSYIDNKTNVCVYFKRRNHAELQLVSNF
jgi:hypothetical protein